MTPNDKVLLSIAYLPPIQYFKEIINAKTVVIEKHENYCKQSYRNRCTIYGANGQLPLTIPVEKGNSAKTKISDIKIAYYEKWQNRHWKSIESAYRSSPFFEFYLDEFLPFYTKKFKFLFDFTIQLLQTILTNTGIRADIQFTTEYIKTQNMPDNRNTIHPKISPQYHEYPKYYQVFAAKHGFIPNLSIIDLMFNTGNQTTDYLSEKTTSY